MIRAIVVDDEPLARERIATLVQETEGLKLSGVASNGLEALDLITRIEPDLVFIDVEMPELDGIGVIAALDVEKSPVVVFITAYERYALSAFDVGAIDYLHKPVTKKRFLSAVDRAKDRLSRHTESEWKALVTSAAQAERERGARNRFVVRKGNAHYFVPAADVEWLDVADNYLRLHVGAKSHFWRGTMKQAEDQLDTARFVRIHRSAMVRIDQILTVRANRSGGHIVELRDGTKLRSSRQYSERVSRLVRG